MIEIQYPKKKPVIRHNNNGEEIFCMIRKKWLQLTPEEWVRQNFLLYLTEVLKYPSSLIAVEKQFAISDVKKRFDIVVYNNLMDPIIIVECKEMNTPISKSTFQQVLQYYTVIQSRFIIVTNGNTTVGFERIENNLQEIMKIDPFIH